MSNASNLYACLHVIKFERNVNFKEKKKKGISNDFAIS